MNTTTTRYQRTESVPEPKIDRFKVISAYHVEDLVKQLNEHYSDGWTVITTIQEHAYTKVLLERDL